jgi:hypothetical protein
MLSIAKPDVGEYHTPALEDLNATGASHNFVSLQMPSILPKAVFTVSVTQNESVCAYKHLVAVLS